MTWRTAYGPISLTTDEAPLPSAYNYVFRIPAATVVDWDIEARLVIRAPSTGSAAYQAMWFGHAAASGDGFDFDSVPVQIKVGDNGAFSVGNGEALITDPFALARIPGRDLLIAYELPIGSRYRKNLSGPPASVGYWKSGSGDSATVNKTGYGSHSPFSASVERIEVQGSDAPPPDEEEHNDGGGDGFAAAANSVRAGEFHSAGGTVAGVAGQYLHFMLKNPNGSGKVVMLYQIMITADADTVVSMRSHGTPLFPNVLPKCNLMFGSGQSVMEMTWDRSPTILGSFHSTFRLRGGIPARITAPVPLIGMLPTGDGVVLAIETPNVGATCNFEWRQVNP